MPALQPADAASGRLEASQVRAMFDRVAAVYDLLNTVMTAGLHHRWRQRAVDLARVRAGDRVLDVATGTGDLAIELARRIAPGGAVVGSDFSEGMLGCARAKAQKLDLEQVGAADRAGRAASHNGRAEQDVRPRLTFEWGDALALPYADGSFDAATVGFGVRNFSDLSRGLAEMVRVVRPGGRVVVLEMTTPTRAPLSWFFGLWFDRLVPIIGRLTAALARLRGASGQGTVAQAYTYLPSSVKRFASPAQLAAELERVGCVEIEYVLLAGGIIAIHGATVPE